MNNFFKKIIGGFLLIVGFVLILNSAGITGFAVFDGVNKDLGSMIGLVFVIVGITLLTSAHEMYRERESKLKQVLGREYDLLSEHDKNTINKSYRRYLEGKEKDVKYNVREEAIRLLNPAGIALEERRIYTRPRELISLAIKCGYGTEKGAAEGTNILDKNGDLLTVIPKHDVDKRTAKRIMKDYATGEPSYRKERFEKNKS